MLLDTILIIVYANFLSFVACKNYTGHAVYKIYAKNLIRDHTLEYLDDDKSIILANGSIPLPKESNKLWQSIDRNGDEYVVVHVEPSKKRRIKRDLNYHLLTDDLNSWIINSYAQSSNANLENVPLENYAIMNTVQQSNNELQNEPITSAKSLDSSESNVFQSYLNPRYNSFLNILQSPFRTLAQLTSWNSVNNWNLIPITWNPNNYQASSLNSVPTNIDLMSSSSYPFKYSQNQISNPNSMTNSIDVYKSSASSNTVQHTATAAAQQESAVYLSAFLPDFRLDIYHNLEEIYTYLEQMVNMHKQMRIFTIGYSNENRPIKAIEIHQDPQNLNKKVVYLDGLIHAREHITTAALLNIIEQILIRKIQCNFLIVPIINVDGYVYTWTTDRLWRKNRKKMNQNANQSFLSSLRSRLGSERCNGVDLNRNFDSNFGGVGSSLNSCSELYAGPHAFSEPETAALARLLSHNRNRIRLFITFQAKSPHHELHMSVLKEVQQAVFDVNNVLYNVGPLGASLYLGSGYSLDYCYEKLNIVHSYLVEVRDNGEYGFLLPPDQILPTSFELLEGLLVSIKRAY